MDIEDNEKILKYKNIYAVYSLDNKIRLNGTSGGFVTHLNEYLFHKEKINSSISYRFNGKELFEPFFAYNEKDIIQTGSIYHDVNLLDFLKSNIDSIRSPIFITCLPCQVNIIKKMMTSRKIEAILVSLICSHQCSKEATYDFLKRKNIDINNISDLRYRGGGWPSGMHIIEKNGAEHFFHNSKSEWNMYFHSTIYTMKRCFYCITTFGVNADFSVSDPWLPRYYSTDTIGHSFVGVKSDNGDKIIKKMEKEGKIKIVEEISPDEFYNAQIEAVKRKKIYTKFIVYKKMIKLFRTPFYKKFFNKYPQLHTKLNKNIRSFFKKRV